MISGHFEPHPGQHAPWPVFALVVRLPDYSTTAAVNFVADTGADMTVVHSRDTGRLVPMGEILEHEHTLLGIGTGEARYATRVLEITLVHDDNREEKVTVTALMAQEGHANDVLPSVIGRDVLRLFRLVVDEATGEVSLS